MLKRFAWMLVGLFCYQTSVWASESVPFISGYVDGSYNYLSNSYQFTSRTPNRLFDIEENGFTLQQATFLLQSQPESGVGGHLIVIGGRDANALAPNGWNPYFGSQTLALDAPEAFLSYKRDAVTVMAGMYSSLVGSESYLYTLNKNFSHSILDTVAEPGRHIGLRMLIAPNDAVTWAVGVANGWSTVESPTRLTRIEFGNSYHINAALSSALQFYLAPHGYAHDDDTATQSYRSLVNWILVYQATIKTQLMVSMDWANQSKALLPNGTLAEAPWRGIAGYVTYQWNDQWAATLRGEVFSDQEGFMTGVKQTWQEATLTVAYQVFKSLLLRAETRHDFSNTNAFLTQNNVGTSNQQQSYALEGLYTF
jgi:hypothetical protein